MKQFILKMLLPFVWRMLVGKEVPAPTLTDVDYPQVMQWVIKAMLAKVLKPATIEELPRLIKEADAQYTSDYQKRNFVHREIRKLENRPDASVSLYNLVVEAAVYLHYKL